MSRSPAALPGLRTLHAANPGPFTLEGTRTHIVGNRRPAVVDPGPADPGHVEALVRALDSAPSVTLLLTHGHGDHAGAVDLLRGHLRKAGGDVRIVGAGHPDAEPPRGAVGTDAGPLLAIPTPGHTADHLAFHWPAGDAVFVGDLILGRGDTTWVGEYPGCVADYLASLARVRELEPALLLPAHGPIVEDPGETLHRFEAHRRARIEQVARVLRDEPGLGLDGLLLRVYGGELPDRVREAARRSLEALVHHLDGR